MDSGYQVQQINKFAVTDYFWRLVNGVRRHAGQQLGGGQRWNACIHGLMRAGPG